MGTFAQRMLAKPGTHNYGRMSVMAQLYFSIGLLEHVPSSAFTPKPKVDSALIRLEKTGCACTEFEGKFINAVFQHRRKKLGNALFDSRSHFGWEKEQARELVENVKYREKRVFMMGLGELLESAGEVEKMMPK